MTRSGMLSVLLALALPLSGHAQASPPGAGRVDQQRIEIADSAAVVVATTLLIGSGTADDPDGLEGLTWTLVDAQARSLRELRGVLAVDVLAARDRVRITVTTTPDAAAGVDAELRSPDALLRGLPAALEAANARFSFTADTPAAEVELESARLFAGFGADWARPVRGTPASVAAITTQAAADRWLQLLEETPWWQVRVGPPAALSAPLALSSIPNATPSRSALAWTTEDRMRIAREVTNVWIVAAFPVPTDLPRTSLDHLVHRVEEIVDPVPGDPGLIAAGAEVLRLAAGDLLVVRATVLPVAATRWEERIRSLPSEITPPFDPDFFRWERRRFRAHLLLRDAAPGPRSQRVAEDLRATGGIRALSEEAWELEPDDLANAAARLGPPRVLVFGPDVVGPEALPGANTRRD